MRKSTIALGAQLKKRSYNSGFLCRFSLLDDQQEDMKGSDKVSEGATEQGYLS